MAAGITPWRVWCIGLRVNAFLFLSARQIRLVSVVYWHEERLSVLYVAQISIFAAYINLPNIKHNVAISCQEKTQKKPLPMSSQMLLSLPVLRVFISSCLFVHFHSKS